MRYLRLTILAALGGISLATPLEDAHADDVVAPPVGQFSFLVGEWECTGQVFAHGTVQAHATTARMHGEKAAGGQWVLFRYDEIATAQDPKPFHIDQYFGYDPTLKKFVSVAVDVVGYFSETSPGWVGDSITFEEGTDGNIVGHDTFTRRGQDEISHSGEDKDKQGRWIKTDEETCHRAR